MVSYHSAESVRRHRYIDDTIAGFADLVDQFETTDISERQVSDKQLKFAAYVLDHLVVPNYDGDRLNIPERVVRRDDEFIPIWALSGEAPRIHTFGYPFHPYQQILSSDAAVLNGISEAAIIRNDSLMSSSGSNISMGSSTLAQVYTRYVVAGKNQVGVTQRIAGRPHIYLNMDSIARSHAPADVIGHEITHVVQYLTQPVETYRTRGEVEAHILRGELEAYSVQSLYQRALVRAGKYNLTDLIDEETSAQKVERIRAAAQTNVEDPFEPNRAVRHAIKQNAGAILNFLPDDDLDQPC